MISKQLQTALNRQLNEELYSSNLYLSLAAFLDHEDFPGMASWMRQQSEQERSHGLRLYHHINDRGGRVAPSGQPAPPDGWRTPREAFESALAHEQHLSSQIAELAELARSEGDHATHGFLQWFVATQADEEATLRDIVVQLRRLEVDPSGMLLMDRQLRE